MMQKRENDLSRKSYMLKTNVKYTGLELLRRRTILKTMVEAVKQGGKIMLTADTGCEVNIKSNFRDFVTEYDKKIQERVMEKISSKIPDAHFVGEEEGLNTFSKTGLNFIIDPIDGTANFIHGTRYSCTAIGCVENGIPIAAATYDPYKDEMFTAIKGYGAFLNGMPIHVSEASLNESFVIFGMAIYNPETFDDTFKRTRALVDRCVDVKSYGSCALDLCQVACGRIGLYFHPSIYLWDYVGGALMIEEAGGVCMNYEGKPLDYNPNKKSSIIVGTKEIIKESNLLNM